MARSQGAEVIDFNADHPVEKVLELTAGIGVDRAVDAVGVDSMQPHPGPASGQSRARSEAYKTGSEGGRSQNEPTRRELAYRRCSIAGARMGSRRFGEGRHAVDHRGLSEHDAIFSGRRGHDEKSNHQHGKLQPPQVSAETDRNGGEQRDSSDTRADTSGAAHVGDRSLPGIRSPEGGLD